MELTTNLGDQMFYYEYIDEIRKAKGSNAKRDVLRKALANPDDTFAEYCLYMYDYSFVFGIRKINRTQEGDWNELGIKFSHVLDVIKSFNGRRSSENAVMLEIAINSANPAEIPYLYDFLDRDMKSGISRSSVNKIFKELHGKELIPEFPIGLCMSYNVAKLTYPLYVEPKMDGMRVLAFVDGQEEIEYKSRNGKEMNHLAERFSKELLELADGRSVVFDGELMGSDFQATMKQARRKTNRDLTAQYFHIFDCVELDQWNKETDIYSERKELLNEMWTDTTEVDGHDFETLIIVDDMMVNDQDEMEELSNQYLADGYEGVILKQDLPYPYEGKKRPTWMKFKPWDTFDCIIVDMYEGHTGKNIGRFGGFIVELDGKTTRCGGGYSDKQRIEFWARDKNEFIGKMVEVQGAPELTDDGCIRFPEFVQFRPDKD
jgi:DNA ligase-1